MICSPRLSSSQIAFQFSIIIFVRTNHNQFQIITNHSVREQILNRLDFEFVDINTTEIALLFFSNRRILHYLFEFLI